MFPNEGNGNRNAPPVEIIVSDMTIFKNNGLNWEGTLLVDTFDNEILASQVVLHSDQCSVYFPQALRQVLEDYNILRSMLRVGTSTDNAIMEAINCWLKEELFFGFVPASVKDISKLLNNEHPEATLGF